MGWATVTKCELHRVEVLYGASARGVSADADVVFKRYRGGRGRDGRPFR